MKKITNIFIISIFIVGFSNAQDNLKNIEYSELLEYKIDQNRFEFGWLDNVFSGIPCFRDYTETNLKTELVDSETDSVFYKSTKSERNGLKIIPENIKIDKKNNSFQINGKITGGWESVIPTKFQIYIGHRKDTISNITLSPNLHGEIYFNGNKVDSTIIVNTIPAFYMNNLKKFEAYRSKKNAQNSEYKEMLFSIKGIIDKKSILVFGLSSRYAEIFEIGKLINE
ncbi:hypothetical protein [Polaribacter sp. Asnod1-A03]|uniref:hypothetical protein n=1 Tax=Polaribacter sp. Asnod1-A03 TaxID=3160581 RepID=UPI00386B09D1